MLEGSVSSLALVGYRLCAATACAVAWAQRRRGVPSSAVENEGRRTAARPLLPRAGQPATDELLVCREVETGLLLLSRTVPDVALHASNLVLLAQLRTALGAPGFYLVCSKLAALLNTHDPAYQDLSAQLARGPLAWGPFLSGIRDLQVPSHVSHAFPV